MTNGTLIKFINWNEDVLAKEAEEFSTYQPDMSKVKIPKEDQRKYWLKVALPCFVAIALAITGLILTWVYIDQRLLRYVVNFCLLGVATLFMLSRTVYLFDIPGLQDFLNGGVTPPCNIALYKFLADKTITDVKYDIVSKDDILYNAPVTIIAEDVNSKSYEYAIPKEKWEYSGNNKAIATVDMKDCIIFCKKYEQ